MEFLEKLLDGVEVEWRELGEIADIYGGLTGKNKSDFTDGNASFITYKNIFDNLSVNPELLEGVKVVESERQNEVRYGDVLFTGSSETVQEVGLSSSVTMNFNEHTYLNSLSFGVRFKEEIQLIPEFSKYLFRSALMREQIIKTANGVTRFNISKARFKKIRIPIVSLPIQAEIVRILDAFTAMTAELTAELNLRQQQYNYYRDQLLSFNEDEVELKTMRSLCGLITTGKLNANAMEEDGTYPFFTCNEKPYKINTFAFDLEAIIVSGNGSQVGHLNYYKGKFNAYQRTYIIGEFCDSIKVSYLYHYLNCTLKSYIIQNSRKGSVPYITMPMLENFQIPIPCPDNPEKSLEEQARIVAILDKFDTLTTSLTEGLPREIELRQKQYEYYRDLLLSFPKPEADAAVST